MSSKLTSVRLDEPLKEQLQSIATATKRSTSFLIAEAVREYVATQEWQLQEIEAGIAEAQMGQLIDHEQIVQYYLEKKRANSMDKNS